MSEAFTRKHKVIIALLLVAVAALGTLLVLSTVQVADKASKGEPYVTTIAPDSPGIPGPQGEQGPPPTQQQISQAVYDYCADTGICDGKTPSLAVVFAAVERFCQNDHCRGASGVDGRDADPVTAAQIMSAVTAYCAEGRCQGEPGQTGAVGASGETPEFRCFEDTEQTPSVVYLQYKLPSQTAWINLIRQPMGSSCEGRSDI